MLTPNEIGVIQLGDWVYIRTSSGKKFRAAITLDDEGNFYRHNVMSGAKYFHLTFSFGVNNWYNTDEMWLDFPTINHPAGTCPKCGDPGKWISLALVCPTHGIFAG